MRSDLKRIASQLHARYGELKNVQFSVDVWWKGNDEPGGHGIRVDWLADEKDPVVEPHGIMWHAESEEEALAVLQWIGTLTTIAAEPKARPRRTNSGPHR